jgi:subtilisin-like proprotein convertase family protein
MKLLLLFFTLCISERFIIQLPFNTTVPDFENEYNLIHVQHILGFDVFKSNGKKSLKRNVPGLIRDLPQKRFKRYDPLYPMQWHLHGSKNGIQTVDIVSGKGINIAIVDDGIEHTHPDLQANYKPLLSWDYNDNDGDPTPNHNDGHGTSCAGVAAAVQNTICGRGVAYNAGIVGIKILGRSVYDFEEALALSHRNDHIHIYSNSWGPMDDGRRMEGPGVVTKTALQRGFESGKNVFVWASGNGRTYKDNANYDGYANSPYTITIGANDYNGDQAYYSEPGANLFALAPSSGAGKGLVTTDLQGAAGYSQGSCTYDFGGTSGAAPLAAGVFAIMLESNPTLSQRDIMHIIAKTNNYVHTHEKGFGILQMIPLLNTLKTYQKVPIVQKKMKCVQSSNQVIPKGYNWLTIDVPAPENMSFVEQVLVTIRMSHGYRGQVLINLQSPLAESILAEHREDHFSGYYEWTYSSVHHWKEEVKQGDLWRLKLRDDTYNEYRGQIENFEIEWWGF